MTRRPKSFAEGLALSAVRRRSEVTLKQIGAPVGDGCDGANHRRKSKERVTAFYELANKTRTVMQSAMHIHPTISELLPTILGELRPLQQPWLLRSKKRKPRRCGVRAGRGPLEKLVEIPEQWVADGSRLPLRERADFTKECVQCGVAECLPQS